MLHVGVLVAFLGTPDLRLLAHEVAIEYGLEPEVFSAIIEQESSFRVNAYNAKTQDYGLCQLNIANIQKLGLDKRRLLYDARYNLTEGAKVLAYMQKRYKHESRYFCRYNVGTGVLGPIRQRNCQMYAEKIEKRLNNYNVAIKD